MSKELVKTKTYGPVKMGGYGKPYRPTSEASKPDHRDLPEPDDTIMEQAKEISKSRGMGEGAARYQYKRLQLAQTMGEAAAAGKNSAAGHRMLNKHYENLARVFNVNTFNAMYGLQDNGDDEMKPKFEKRMPHKMKKGDVVCMSDSVIGILQDKQIMGPSTRMVFQDRSIMADSFSYDFSIMLDGVVSASSAQGSASLKQDKEIRELQDAYPTPNNYNNSIYNKKETLPHTLVTNRDSVKDFHHGLQNAFSQVGIKPQEGDHFSVTMPGTKAQYHGQVQNGKLTQFEPDNRNNRKLVTHGDYNNSNMKKFNSTGASKFTVNDKNNPLNGATIHHLKDKDHYNNIIKSYQNNRTTGKGPSSTMAEDFEASYKRHAAIVSDKNASPEQRAISQRKVNNYNSFKKHMEEAGEIEKSNINYNPNKPSKVGTIASRSQEVSKKTLIHNKNGSMTSTGRDYNGASLNAGTGKSRNSTIKGFPTGNKTSDMLSRNSRATEKIDARGQTNVQGGFDSNKDWNNMKNGHTSITLTKNGQPTGKPFIGPTKDYYDTYENARNYAKKHNLDFSKHIAFQHGNTTATSSTVSEKDYQQALEDRNKSKYHEKKQAMINNEKLGSRNPGDNQFFRRVGGAKQKTIIDKEGKQVNVGVPHKSDVRTSAEGVEEGKRNLRTRKTTDTSNIPSGSTKGGFAFMNTPHGVKDISEARHMSAGNSNGNNTSVENMIRNNKDVSDYMKNVQKKGGSVDVKTKSGKNINIPGSDISLNRNQKRLSNKFNTNKKEVIKHNTISTKVPIQEKDERGVWQSKKDEYAAAYKEFKEKTK